MSSRRRLWNVPPSRPSLSLAEISDQCPHRARWSRRRRTPRALPKLSTSASRRNPNERRAVQDRYIEPQKTGEGRIGGITEPVGRGSRGAWLHRPRAAAEAGQGA